MDQHTQSKAAVSVAGVAAPCCPTPMLVGRLGALGGRQ